MMAQPMTEWRPVHVGFEGDDAEIGGIKVWRQTWRPVASGPASLPHPAHPSQTHQFHIFEIGPEASPTPFAAGELSNGVWGFYIPKGHWRYRVIDVVPAPGPGKVLLVGGTTDLPTGAGVRVKLELPNEGVFETTGAKVWELPVGELPGKHDAFRLPSFERDLPDGTLVEIAKAHLE